MTDALKRVMPATTDALIGADIDGRFSITHKLGSGGMGAVYAAIQRSMGREIAIKVIHPELACDVPTAKRFLREAWLASRLVSPHVAAIHDFGRTDDGMIYMAMERVAGHTVAHELRKNGALSPLRTVQIGMQICLALEAAHAMGIVHRDLKPANIMLQPVGDGEQAKVLDFGLAKSIRASAANNVTEAGLIVGTSRYIAPELIRGEPPAPTSDLYSLGAVLYTMLARRQPFVGDELTVLRSHVLHAPPPLPAHVPLALADVVYRLLAKSPSDRYACAAELREALAMALSAPRRQVPPVTPQPIEPDGPLETEIISADLDSLLVTDELDSLLITDELDSLPQIEIEVAAPSPRVATETSRVQPLARPRSRWRALALTVALCALLTAVVASAGLLEDASGLAAASTLAQ